MKQSKNNPSKKIIFISHISEEKELACLFKELIEKAFLGMVDVFVSSDENSIALGQKWLDNITQALNDCVIEIILCSSESITRPWVNFEAGAGWIRKIPVIPLCHSGLTPTGLPIPLKLLQSVSISEEQCLKSLFKVIAQQLSSDTPSIDFSSNLEIVRQFEKKYRSQLSTQKHNSKEHKVVVENISVSDFLPYGTKRHKYCSKCKFGFTYESNSISSAYGALTGSKQAVKCPECGNTDTVS